VCERERERERERETRDERKGHQNPLFGLPRRHLVIAEGAVPGELDHHEAWEALLLPVGEPPPELYSSYSEYVKALVGWAQLCVMLPFSSSSSCAPPPNAAQFSDRLPMASPIEKEGQKNSNHMREEGMNADGSPPPSGLLPAHRGITPAPSSSVTPRAR